MCEISVIIPVYNVEKYLKECLDSVVNQTFKDIEIMCVNDGSSDGSLTILKQYADRDNRIKIITQKNQGLGAARNTGLKKAKGKYIYFIDSDDYINVKTLEKLYNNIISNNSDMVLFKFQSFGGDKNIYKQGEGFKLGNDYSNLSFNYNDIKRHVLNSAYSACLKLYKKEFLDSFDDFYFYEGLLFEDVPFHVKAMLRASKLSYVNESLYYYRQNEDSLINTQTKSADIFKIIDIVESFLKDEKYYFEFEGEFLNFKIDQIFKFLNSSDEEYFLKAKNEFMRLDLNNDKINNLDNVVLVLNSKNYNDFLIKYYSNEISILKHEIKTLKDENYKISSSKSWKLTKPLRYLMKIFR